MKYYKALQTGIDNQPELYITQISLRPIPTQVNQKSAKAAKNTVLVQNPGD
tara:strand:+ start:117 stop:269 length:153 start_codon:yes stop_codon:yes gene_type:complete